MESEVGKVTHYYTHIGVASVKLSDKLKTGDMIHIVGHTSDFTQKVDSIQIEHESVLEANAGQEIGIKVIEHAREHDTVYKIVE